MGVYLELSKSNEIMKVDYILNEYENFGHEINIDKLFQEYEEVNVIRWFNGLLVTIPTRGIRVDCALLHVDMIIDSIASHDKFSLMGGFLKYS